MKQISKIFFGLLFVSGLFLTLPNQMFAQYQAILPTDDGGGGGGGGGSGTTTPTANATLPTAATAFNLTANLDQSSYNAGDSMTLTSLVSMSACLNSANNFLVTGTILDSGNPPTTISDFRNPNEALYGSGINFFSYNGSNLVGGASYAGSSLVGGASFQAPSVGGDYFIRIDTTYTYLPAKLIIKQTNGISYLYDMNNNIYYATKLPIHNFGTSGQNYEISTNSSGKVLSITNIGGTSSYGTGVDGEAFTDIVAETRTISTYVPFTVIPPPPAPALSVQVFANGGSSAAVPYNHTATITWKTTGNPTSCVCSYSSPATSNSPATSGPCGTGVNSNSTIPVQAQGIPNLKANTTFNVTCTDIVVSSIPPPKNPVPDPNGGYVCPSYYPSCFIADTVVQMADGTTKNIQDVKIGDILKGEKTNNKVLGFHDPKLNDKKLYSFNGGRYFVTAEHPFKTIDGWKSINPALTANENIGITVTELKVGDTLITESGKVLLKTIDSKNDKADTQLYNFILDGDHTYYADQYLVHNKLACVAGQVPNIAGGCDYCGFPCPSGYTKSCTGGATLCTQDSCGGYVTTYSCTGTVAGSSPSTYEGQSCSQFGTQATCQQGWLTHGCSWNGVADPLGGCGGSLVCTKYKTQANCSANAACTWTWTAAQ